MYVCQHFSLIFRPGLLACPVAASEGLIPKSISQLSNLQILSLRGNSLKGKQQRESLAIHMGTPPPAYTQMVPQESGMVQFE